MLVVCLGQAVENIGQRWKKRYVVSQDYDGVRYFLLAQQVAPRFTKQVFLSHMSQPSLGPPSLLN
jgi:hypothetical protein